MINIFNPLALFMLLKYKLSTETKNMLVFFLKAYIYFNVSFGVFWSHRRGSDLVGYVDQTNRLEFAILKPLLSHNIEKHNWS